MLEEQKMLNQTYEEDSDYIVSFIDVPYFLFDEEITPSEKSQYTSEITEIKKYYRSYKKGIKFTPEGSNGDYVPSNLRYKKSAMIMNKEARFLFSNPPTFNVNADDVDGTYKKENAIIQDFLDKVLEKNNFNGNVLKALKDCFIGKRIAIVLNFNEMDGITITFLNSLEFVYKTSSRGNNELTKFVTFYNMTETDSLKEQRWFKKVYVKEEDGVYVEENIYSGNGDLIEVVTPKTKIKFNYIPAVVVLNDGLIGDKKGESELSSLLNYEKNYSKLANADMDAERKSMNPTRYTIDASQESTKNLPITPGSYWDIQSDEDKPETRGAKVGILEPNMHYSNALKTTLDRIENEMFAELDVPNINSEQLAGVITSGKTIEALYWGLTVRCDEKMLAWGWSLKFIAYAIIEGGILYPNCISRYTDEKEIPDIPISVVVENNYPLPEDVQEEKTMDITEVEANVMSRKAYLKKWRGLTDKEADKELEQIRMEKEMLENSYSSDFVNNFAGNSNQQQDENLEDEDFDDEEE